MKAMTAGEFIRALERIENEIGDEDNLIFHTKYKNQTVVVWFGQYEKDLGEYLEWSEDDESHNELNDKMLDNQVAELNIIPNVPERGQVYFYSESGPWINDDLEWLFGHADDFKYAFKKGHVKDTDVIVCLTLIPTSNPSYFETFNATITKITNDGTNVILHVEPYNGSVNAQRKPDVYEIDYSVWEQNRYTVEIEAMSQEEAEAKFYEKYSGEGEPYRTDEEIIAIRKK